MQINQELCKKCGKCIHACPKQAIYTVGDKVLIERGECAGCGMCASVCENDAIVRGMPDCYGKFDEKEFCTKVCRVGVECRKLTEKENENKE